MEKVLSWPRWIRFGFISAIIALGLSSFFGLSRAGGYSPGDQLHPVSSHEGVLVFLLHVGPLKRHSSLR